MLHRSAAVGLSVATYVSLLTSVLFSSGASSLIRHPRFAKGAPIQADAVVDGHTWYASCGTSIRGSTEGSYRGGLTMDFVIEHLPNKNDFQLGISIKCSLQTATAATLHRNLPFTFSGETFCDNEFPFVISTVFSEWLEENGQFKYMLRLSLKIVDFSQSSIELKNTFSKIAVLKFEFYCAQWRLQTNSLYLWRWDSAFPTSYRDTPLKNFNYFLTDAAFDLMMRMKVPDLHKSFDSIQFIEPSFVQLVSRTSEYIQNYINIEAIMLMGYGMPECWTHYPKHTAVFGSHKAGVIEEHDLMLKVSHLDWQTGRLTFSLHGLSSAMIRFNEYNREYIRWDDLDRYTLRICAGVELFVPIAPVKEFRTARYVRKAQLNYTKLGSLNNECEIVGPSTRQVTFFARSGKNQLICPIICSNYQEPFVFSKGDVTFSPNVTSTRDRVGYINDTIYAYKAGTVIEFREDDVTHEDAGQYKCTAGGKTVTFEVSVVSMPVFFTKLLSGKRINGELPERIYAVEGEGYSVSCTIFFSGLHNSTSLEPEFYLKSGSSQNGNYNWMKKSWTEFVNEAKKQAQADILVHVSESSSQNSQTIKLIVRNVPAANNPELSLFNHRFLCSATAAPEDANRYGMQDFAIQSGADVHFVQRLRISDFIVSASDSCLQKYSKLDVNHGNCSVKIALRRDLLDYLTNIGLRIETDVFLDDVKVTPPAVVTVTSTTAGITFEFPDPSTLKSTPLKRDIAILTPVFCFKQSQEADSTYRIIRGGEFIENGDRACLSDPACIYSSPSMSISVGDIVFMAAKAASVPLPAWLN